MHQAKTHPDGQTRARSVFVIFNPTAGRLRRKRLLATLAWLRSMGCRVTVHDTTCRGDAEAVARRIRAEDYDVLVAAGGDGTINEVINGLAAAEAATPPLAVIPLGTANVLAKEIGLPTTPATVARCIAEGRPVRIHLGVAGGRHFCLMAGVGLDAHVVEHVSGRLKKMIGKGAYVWETLRQVARYRFPPLRLVIDGQEMEARGVVACKGRHYGGPYVAAPKASLLSPSLEVVVLTQGGWWNTARYGIALMTGRLASLTDVHVLTARSLAVVGDDGGPVQGDGDTITRSPVEITVANLSIDLLVP